jgi:hypothetical protein
MERKESTCPRCGEEMGRDEADIGIGIIYGPWGCGACGYSEHEAASKVIDGRYHDIYGGAHSVERIVEGCARFGLGDLAREAFDGEETCSMPGCERLAEGSIGGQWICGEHLPGGSPADEGVPHG